MMPRFAKIIIFFVFLGIALPLRAEEDVGPEILSWQDCVKEAAKNHPDLISSQEAVKQSEAAKNITASTLLPQVDSSAGFTRTRTSTTSVGKTTKKTSNSFTYGVTGTQLLFDGGKTSNNVKAGVEDIKAAQYNYKFTSTEVRLRLRTAFIDMLKAQELLNLTQEIYNIRRGNLELITLRYQSGMEHRGALLTAEANLAQSQFEIAQAHRTLEVAQRDLIKEMGRTQFSALRVKGGFNVRESSLERPDFETLAQNNPSLGKLLAQKNAASFGIKASEANFFPQLSASMGANRTSSDWPPRNNQMNAGLTLSFPLLEGGLRAAEVEQAKAIFNQAEANERSSRDSVILALEQTWAALLDAVETQVVESKFLAAASERANIAEAQYSLGLVQFDNWTIIEDDLVNTKKAYLGAQANTLTAEANWIQAKGETLEYAS
ncbi:MAG: TolC family protein [Candidatus Omnitrophica bacterium]|nr:TolC family protein [Candidatus Omnitrophota bacterium]